MMNYEQSYLISDLTWFSLLINEFSNSKLKSNDFTELNDIMGPDVPVYTFDTLKDFLSKELSNEKVFEDLILKNT